MEDRNCLILTQYRKDSDYNDFIGKYYHFPATIKKNYLNQFISLPIEVVYYEPDKKGEGVFYGYGKITKTPFIDKKTPDHYFVEISDFKLFSKPVFFKDENGEILEKLHNTEYYNYNNAVRKIKPQFLDELCLDGGILLNFKADAHLVQVLGEQLIASERVGILELVKNSIDAGASYCKVKIEKVPNLPDIPESLYEFNEYDGPVIIIEDDGSGMTKEQIELGWLRPASTLKTNVKEKLKREREKAIRENKLETYENYLKILKAENKGRIPLGEKGVGRFACHRLGKKIIIKTKIKRNNYEFILKIDWDDFNFLDGSHKDLDDVKVSLTRQAPSRDYGSKGSGTQLIIFGGREGFELSEDEIKEINRTLIKLNSPKPNPDNKLPSFTVSFECLQIPTLEEKPVHEHFEPIFTITGIVDDWGKFNYDFLFSPPNSVPMPKDERKDKIQDLRTQLDDKFKSYWQMPEDPKKLRKPVCGSFFVHLNVWYRRSPWVEGPFAGDFIKELDKYGGISVFRDGINVFPAEWGAETDWLELTKAHIKKGSNISYRDIIGNIEIEQSINFNLIDKTNREGVLHNRAYNDFKRLIQGIIALISIDVKGKRDDFNKLTGNVERDLGKLSEASKAASDILERIDDKYDVPNDPLGILERLGEKHEKKTNLTNLQRSLKNLEKSLAIIKDNQDIMTEQAGFGLSMAVVVHEIAKTTSNFYNGIIELMKSKTLNQEKLELLKDASLSLQSEIKRISPLRAIKNEPEVEFNISRSIKFCKEVFKPPFRKSGIEFSYNSDKDFSLIARYGAINQVLTNLFDNSVYWLSRIEDRERKIFVQINNANKTIIVADSGDGIHESMLPYLFRPGYSMKWPPSGIGLYVCKYYMQDIKGDIYLTNERERISGYSGAQFTLDFSRVKGKENDK
jgi:signal transduction histidine kinase